MVAEPHYLVLERLGDDVYLILAEDTAVWFFARRTEIFCPFPMTTPTHKDEESHLVAEVIQVL